jgi:aldose 1-epimerase
MTNGLVPPTGEQFELRHGGQHAVVTAVGATLRSYTVGGEPVVDGFGVDEIATAGSGQVLAPWPNRLAEGRYSFEGRDGHAALDEPEKRNAVHGLVRWWPWTCGAYKEDSVELTCVLQTQPAYPWSLRLRVRYRLDDSGLVVSTEATNVGDAPAPFGLGFHPYLTVGTPTVDTARLLVPARRRLTTDERDLPTGEEAVEGTAFDFIEARPIGTMKLDTCFTDLVAGPDGRTVVELAGPDRCVGLWMEGDYRYVMVFTGDTRAPDARRLSVAVEPMTCPPNALRSGTDLIRLAPGDTWTGTWGITPTPVSGDICPE